MKEYSQVKVKKILAISAKQFESWKKTDFETRKKILLNVAKILKRDSEKYAKIITLEMGKRIAESKAEVEKCAWVCEYYANSAKETLKTIEVDTEAEKSMIFFEPLGIILAIMPWNFPFWQVFRCAVPAIMAGNTVLLKHASNVPKSAINIEKIFAEAGAPKGLFTTLLISSSKIGQVIEDERVRVVSLTGSEEAGSKVAEQAGKNIKKTILELGGSDPFIVMADADVEKAVNTAVISRMIVSGQSCIAAKRFIVQEKIFDKFVSRFKEILESKKIGDPMDPSTEVGPLSSLSILETIDNQVKKSVKMGAKLVTGGERWGQKGFYYYPTIMTNVTQNMPVFAEETFGPVAAIMSVKSVDEAIAMANNSHFGLGASVWTKNKKNIDKFVRGIGAGAVFVNSMVKSDPRLPFGGSKFSGYGRELAEFGIKEFVNVKTVWID